MLVLCSGKKHYLYLPKLFPTQTSSKMWSKGKQFVTLLTRHAETQDTQEDYLQTTSNPKKTHPSTYSSELAVDELLSRVPQIIMHWAFTQLTTGSHLQTEDPSTGRQSSIVNEDVGFFTQQVHC